MVLTESNGFYSQTIRLGSVNEVEFHMNGKELFKGEEQAWIGGVLSFKR